MKRTKKNSSPAVATVEDDANGNFQDAVMNAVVELETEQTDEPAPEVAETVTPVIDEDVLALIAGSDDEPEAPVAETETSEGGDPADSAPAPVEIDADEPTDDEVLATIAGSGKQKAPKAPKAPKAAPAIMREFTAVAQIDQATLDANLAACTAKKVREKIDNLIAAIQTGKKLSVYTQVAVRELVANGSISGKDMVSAFLTAGLKEGTARAQAQQMTSLFKVVGAVVPDATQKGRLVANDKGLIDELAKLAA